VQVIYNNKNKLYRIKSKTAVMASGGWVNRRILKDLPGRYHEAYNKFNHSPVLVANVALTNWRFLERLGISAAFWTEGIGFTCNIRRPMIVGNRSQPLNPDKPIVMTFYIPIIKPGLQAREQGALCRAELLSKSFKDYEREIREQMTLMFSSGGFDPTNDIAGIILNRWGHAYVNPGLGFVQGLNGSTPPSDILRKPYGRIAIGHSELRGHQYWNGAAGEGRRAAESLLDKFF
jgi:spermidine dehydrogenase